MKKVKFNNNSVKIETIINNGYTVKAGTVGGNSIEILENCLSIIYYDNVVARDADLAKIQKMVANAR